MITEHANANPDINTNDVKEFLHQAVASRAAEVGEDEPFALRLSDVSAAKKKFVDPKFKPTRKSRSGPRTSAPHHDDGDDQEVDSIVEDSNTSGHIENQRAKPTMDEVQATDDEDELANDASHQRPAGRPASSKFLVAIKSKRPFHVTANTEAATDNASVSDSNVTTAASPIYVPHNRERSVTPVSLDRPNKRVRGKATSSHQETSENTRDSASPAFDRYDDNSELHQAAQTFHQRLADHVRVVGKQHEEKAKQLTHLQQSVHQRIEAHQQHLTCHRAAQANFLAAETKLSNLRDENQRLTNCQKTLDDAKDVWMQISQDKFAALEQDHQAQMSANLVAFKDAESQLDSARSALEDAETAARPALILMNQAKPRLDEIKVTAGKLAKHMMHVDFLRLLVRTGPGAIAALENLLRTKDVLLKDLANKILQNPNPSEVGDSQSSNAPTV
ncbi:hypothetical protein FSARC_3621 [Fusarium sarcochroum]|uniref:Uncharacterized protein n=1 Tax=Fusarium sarcochroum TaxID=1208366 RepID=A0A8H4U3P3_9HYPO|nr:hypothetical protein FSARC_3621 [Fusarium sarcochroum]